jgi:DNA invertase Pin-like site-specific DNA recombinase
MAKKIKGHQVIGYLRVSTADQDVSKNKAAILAFANDKGIGKVSGLI